MSTKLIPVDMPENKQVYPCLAPALTEHLFLFQSLFLEQDIHIIFFYPANVRTFSK